MFDVVSGLDLHALEVAKHRLAWKTQETAVLYGRWNVAGIPR